MHSDYSIWILEYASVPHQTSEAAYAGFARVGETLYFPFSFVLVRGNGRNILIDCGIDFSSATKQGMAAEFRVENRHCPADVLAEVGLTPGDIDIIIPTHAHWDHMGALRAFPRATVYVQREEIDSWKATLARPKYAALFGAMDADDLAAIDDLDREGRVVYLEGEVRDLLPGVHIWVDRNGHSHASQLVLVESGTGVARDHYIAVGDVAYRLENLTGLPEHPHFLPNTKWAIGGAYSTFRTYDRILDYVGEEVWRILVEHDSETWSRHPSVQLANGLHIAEVRLAPDARSQLCSTLPRTDDVENTDAGRPLPRR